ncbi:MAG: S8 family peptidase [Ignavibacteriaceae bacterium]|nr:S8 family peptidase [Ignavibacteriaceae bacterium]
MAEQYKHLFITNNAKTEKYKPPPSQGAQPTIPVRERATHSSKLLQQFEQIRLEKENLNTSRSAERITTREGTYLSFTSGVGADLITKSLENLQKGIRLLNIKEEDVSGENNQIRAVVYIPKGEEGYFISKIEKYRDEDTKGNKPKNAPLVNSIEDVSTALLEGLWNDNVLLIPNETAQWCEVWLNVNEAETIVETQINSFIHILGNIGIEYKNNRLKFPERRVMLIKSNKAQLIELMQRSDLLAEFRAGQEMAGFWMNETTVEQQAWVEDLLSRLEIEEGSIIRVCILDGGINNGHPLLHPILEDANTLTVDPSWGTNDHYANAGHGTLMAGLAGYGNFEVVLSSANPVSMTHKLCSIKILPPPNATENPKELWGDITSQGISRAEIQNPENKLLFCMAITSKDDTNKGRPSSWSGEMDNLAYGDGNNKRLIIISAGNVDDDDLYRDYPNSNFTSSIENPAQSWNSLTVGANTNKILVNDPIYNNHTPIAQESELSPYSTTSIIWEKKWPVKPDVVFEGGNLLKAPDNSIVSHDDLELLSTSKSFNRKPFDTINATSAATALASWFAAKIANEYPNIWPETIRGLMVHSSEWSQAMLQQINVRQNYKSDYRNLLRTFGYGVPDLNKALYSSESALTYISQESIQPFGFNINKQPETKEIHFYDLPWPKDLLLSLGAIPVKLKVTLSYFIEPSPSDIGWKDRYRYQSFGLRFDVNNVDEEEVDFRKRINAEARDEEEELNSTSGSNRWTIGSNNRNNGSIHSDFWEGTAAELSTCNKIAVFPIIGWWRVRKNLDKVETKARYSLIISLETPAQDVELYTTVKTMIETRIAIQT